jgi:hypothetical protein
MRKVNVVGAQKSVEDDMHAGQDFRGFLSLLHLAILLPLQ